MKSGRKRVMDVREGNERQGGKQGDRRVREGIKEGGGFVLQIGGKIHSFRGRGEGLSQFPAAQ